MSNDKFFGNVKEKKKEAEVKELILDKEVLAEALSADDEIEVSGVLVEESLNPELSVLEGTVEINLPYTAVSYFKDNSTGQYNLVTIDYNPVTGELGAIDLNQERTSPDKSSIEEEFKIEVVNSVFSK